MFALDTTTVCVSVFIVALGGLWMYVMFARPTSRTSELEELLSEEASKPEGAKVRAGKKGSRGKGKSRAVSFETFWKFYCERVRSTVAISWCSFIGIIYRVCIG